MPRIIVDFDRTLFDSDRLYQDLYSLCEQRGVGRTYLSWSQGFLSPQRRLFNFSLMVMRSQALDLANLHDIAREIEHYVAIEGTKYVFEDVGPFLNAAKLYGYEVDILTYGERRFQQLKLEASKLARLCRRSIITQRMKWQCVEIFAGNVSAFLDDNPRNIDGVKTAYPYIKTIEVKRIGTKYQNMASTRADAVFSDLIWSKMFDAR